MAVPGGSRWSSSAQKALVNDELLMVVGLVLVLATVVLLLLRG